MKKLLLTNKQFLLHWKGRTNLAFDLKISVEQNQFQELQENYFVVLLHLDNMCLPPAAAFLSDPGIPGVRSMGPSLSK